MAVVAAGALALVATGLLAMSGDETPARAVALGVARRVGLALALLAAGWGVGAILAERLLAGSRRRGGEPFARSGARASGGAFGAAMAMAFGLAALGWGTLLFGGFGFATTRGLTLLFLLFAVASLATWRARAANGRAAEASPDAGASPRAHRAPRSFAAAMLGRVPSVALAAFVVPFAIAALAPPAAYDVLEYHLGGPVGWLETGSLAPARGNFYTALPSSLEAVYAIALALGGQSHPKLIHFATLLAWLVVSGRLFRALGVRDARLRAAGLLLMLAFPSTFESASDANNDLAVALFHALAFVAIAEGWGAGRAGLLAGVGMGFKFTMLTVGVGPFAVAIAALALARPGGFSAKRLAGDLARFAAGVAIGFAPWALRAWWFTGFPLFPSTALAIPSPGADPAMGLEWNAALAAEYLAVHLAKAPWQAAWLDQWFARLGQWGWGWVGAIAAGLALGASGWRRAGATADRRAGAAALAALGGTAAWSLLGTSPQRFLIPLLPLATGCLLLAIRRSIEFFAEKRSATRAMALAIAAALLALVAAPRFATLLFTLDRLEMIEAALYPSPAWNYQKTQVGWGDAPIMEALEEASDLAEAADAPPVRVFALYEARIAHLPVPAATVTVHDAFPPELGSLAQLRAAGFTHLLVNEIELERLRSFYPPRPENRARFIGDVPAKLAPGSPRTIPGRFEFYADWLPWSGPANATRGTPALARELVEARGRAVVSSGGGQAGERRVWLLDLR